jgi:hypothetical protein
MLVFSNPGCEFVQDLECRNLIVNYIRAKKEAGLGNRTQNNLFGAIVTFLHAQQHPVVTRKDAPERVEPRRRIPPAVRVPAEHGVKFWIITEADRSATTFLLPDEY